MEEGRKSGEGERENRRNNELSYSICRRIGEEGHGKKRRERRRSLNPAERVPRRCERTKEAVETRHLCCWRYS